MERWIAEFERHLVERRYADATRRAYADELRRFEAFARSRLKRPVAVPRDLTAELIAAFAAARSLERIDARQRNHARTLARSLAAVRGFLRYLERRGESVGEARAGFPRVSLPETLPSALGEAALNALLDGAEVAAKSDPRACRAVAAAECLYGAGLRVGELAGLTRSGLDEKRRLVRVLGKAPASAWCRSGTRAPGAPALLGGARARAGSRRSDHLRPRGGRDHADAERDIRGLLARLGPNAASHPHALRHSFATISWSAAPTCARPGAARHRNLQTTQIYTRDPSPAQAAYERAHPRA